MIDVVLDLEKTACGEEASLRLFCGDSIIASILHFVAPKITLRVERGVSYPTKQSNRVYLNNDTVLWVDRIDDTRNDPEVVAKKGGK